MRAGPETRVDDERRPDDAAAVDGVDEENDDAAAEDGAVEDVDDAPPRRIAGSGAVSERRRVDEVVSENAGVKKSRDGPGRGEREREEEGAADRDDAVGVDERGRPAAAEVDESVASAAARDVVGDDEDAAAAMSGRLGEYSSYSGIVGEYGS